MHRLLGSAFVALAIAAAFTVIVHIHELQAFMEEKMA